MKNAHLPALLVCFLSFAATAHAEEVAFKNIIDKSMKCDNPSGNEIKDVAHVSAPPDKVFEKDSIKIITDKIRSYTDAVGAGGCFLDALDWKTETIKTQGGHDVPVSLLIGFNVRAHADCGSGELRTADHISKNESITATCSVRVNAYNIKDLK